MLKRAFIYARVSTKQQLEKDGFPRQIAACQAFAEKEGWSIARTFTEQQTGSDEYVDRKELNEAIELSGRESVQKVSAIIIENADRLARDMLVSELFFRECRERGILVYGADSGEELVNASSNPSRVLIRQVLCAIAQYDKAMTVNKLQSGRRRKAAQTGKPCGGTRPYANPFIISEIIRLREAEQWSFGRIVKHFARCQIPTPSGLPIWSAGTVCRIYYGNSHAFSDPQNSPFRPRSTDSLAS